MGNEALTLLRRVRNQEKNPLKKELWLQYLYLTKEHNVNLERVLAVKDRLVGNPVLDYVEKTLELLAQVTVLTDSQRFFAEQALCWSEVSKCGLPHQRQEWENNGFDLAVHNVGSAQIYGQVSAHSGMDKEVVHALILTHGLIGQYLRGETLLAENDLLTELIRTGRLSKTTLARILYVLNKSVIGAVSMSLWEKLALDVSKCITRIVNGDYEKAELSTKERTKRLRAAAACRGEAFDYEYAKLLSENPEAIEAMEKVYSRITLWYVEAATADLSFDEFVKIMLISYLPLRNGIFRHLSFEGLMNDLYYDRNGKKTLNLYKKRILEMYLKNISIESILKGQLPSSPHVQLTCVQKNKHGETLNTSLVFSAPAEKLIEFCEEAEKVGTETYRNAIFVMLDFFGFRRDQYDRFYNEGAYLDTMNAAIGYKSVLSRYIPTSTNSDVVVDIGPGGGAFMDLLCLEHPNMRIVGVDASESVVEKLHQIKVSQNKSWEILKGDARRLGKRHVFPDGTSTRFWPDGVAAVMFCSVLHEIFSYNDFSYNAVLESLKSAYKLLCKGGRIIIRDGIMSERKQEDRIIRFKTDDGMPFFLRYANDFKGRRIQYEILDDSRIRLGVNDAMEFLYTYTWGEESYPCEVKEQFGYFTPSEYEEFIHEVLGDTAKIILSEHFLQDGYEEHLLPKIDLMDGDGNPTRLPDSTAILVIEKT